MHRLTELDVDARTAVCSECGPVGIRSRGPGRWRCGPAQNTYLSASEARRARRRERERDDERGPHGLTIKEARIARDGAACAICGGETRLNVDHDHATGRLRGILCHSHNTGIGFFHDSVEELEAAIRYLKSYA